MSDQLRLPKAEREQNTGSDPAVRAKYLERLRQHLQDPAFRAIEGFPIGADEAILALSDPPYYTACPNPFLPEIIEAWQQERQEIRKELDLPDDSDDNGNDGPAIYQREPFASDVSEGKNDPIYNAHSYHTKVPHKAIMRYILHYTDPGDIVFDGFCGTGMTGVAAQLCGDRKTVESLGYHVDQEGWVYDSPPEPSRRVLPSLTSGRGVGGEGLKRISCLGPRKAVLVDLCPAATFIAYNYNTPVDVEAFECEAQRILREVEKECGWMYETWHPHCEHPQRGKGRINCTVWSDVFVCPQCGEEMIFWDVAVDKEAGSVRRDWSCPGCGALLAKSPRKQSGALRVARAWETVYGRALGQTIRRARQVPVLINYSVSKKRHEKVPDAEDLTLIRRIEASEIPCFFPTEPLPDGYNTRQPMESHGITHVHHFYTRRNLSALSAVKHKIDYAQRTSLDFMFSSMVNRATKMNRIHLKNYAFGGGGWNAGYLKGTLYVSSIPIETSVIKQISDRVKWLRRGYTRLSNRSNASCTATVSASTVLRTDNCLDYIFVDPPFGGNLMYSELNFLWEAWLRVFTNNQSEAIVNKVQRKGLSEYQHLMERCFGEFYRVLRPGRWMTVEFHNSRNSIWNAIQEAILRAGFMIADVRTLDKQQGTFKQVTSTAAVKQDLIISAYKPRAGFERRFLEKAGTSEGAWDFVRQHLGQLPVGVERDGVLEVVAERQAYLLFDRMVAFHIQRGASVPLSAAEFYAGLCQRFVERDGMFFLPDQVPEYDRARLQASEVEQLTLFVSDEKSAIQWLRQQLDPGTGGSPQTYAEIQPGFLQQLHQAKHEALPELGEVLEQSFLRDEEGRWYVPDANRASDLEKLRRKSLLREFSRYVEGRGRLRQFRTEAVRAGFADAWHRRDYATIVAVAERLPSSVLQEDASLLMYYDNASLRVE